MPVSQWNALNQALEKANIKLVGVKDNLIDSVWGSNQPDRPNQPVVPLEMKFTGIVVQTLKLKVTNLIRVRFVFSTANT